MKREFLAGIVLGVFFVGCGGEPADKPANKQPAAPVVDNTPAPPPPAPTVMVQEKAEVGMGKKGHGYGEGPIATPIATKFRIEERLVLMNIEHAMDLFKATEGRPPKSHEEFMKKIIQENNIKLPELPTGQRYIYDPEKAELMVEKPQ